MDFYKCQGLYKTLHQIAKAYQREQKCSFLYYPGYRAVSAETGEHLAVVPGGNNVLRVEVPSGYTGGVAVDFIGKGYWKVGNAVSVVLWIGVLAFGIMRYRLRKRISGNSEAEETMEE